MNRDALVSLFCELVQLRLHIVTDSTTGSTRKRFVTRQIVGQYKKRHPQIGVIYIEMTECNHAFGAVDTTQSPHELR